MPAERETPGSPKEWLARARSDLALAKIPLPSGGAYEDLCFFTPSRRQKRPSRLCIVPWGWSFDTLTILQTFSTA